MDSYFSLVLLFGFGILFVTVMLGLSQWFSISRTKKIQADPYECGFYSEENPRQKFSVKFYLVAMLFILFDVEVIFVYPFAVLFREFLRDGMGLFLAIEMAVFLGVLLLGLVYVYGRRALDWNEYRS